MKHLYLADCILVTPVLPQSSSPRFPTHVCPYMEEYCRDVEDKCFSAHLDHYGSRRQQDEGRDSLHNQISFCKAYGPQSFLQGQTSFSTNLGPPLLLGQAKIKHYHTCTVRSKTFFQYVSRKEFPACLLASADDSIHIHSFWSTSTGH